ncbi:hypothetical protein SAMN02745127_01866 [Oceanospirillum multiglobuliferum]|uniref:Uncharacterized protein n=1 Tax=Oceanospirillum multiglobuliferum TaxID=64969 RepID=A0A1T4QDP0_9GAMM|nr:hypothetical protein [Oceanospirillum multiglobuliferum]OPX56499.1 hypothetical protein BTE48_03475 [Oceanospirillum multiglobuliferum]SKA01852.1 hypothetical protein SAMN02745127_01866 [Oceanospirillum multiglobuliferum]
MQVYRVYQHPVQGYAALVSGFNWSAAIFSMLWTMANNLWGPSFILLLGYGFCLTGVIVGMQMNLTLLALTFLAIAVFLPIWSGMSAMTWQEQKLAKQGYRLVHKVRAQSAQGAIQTTQRKASPKHASTKTGRTTAR